MAASSFRAWETAEWKALAAHAAEIKESSHLRDLLQDDRRCKALTATAPGPLDVHMDYSRQLVTTDTMEKLFGLFNAAGVPQKIEAMFSGEKINSTEGRAVMHPALRAPRGFEGLSVDGKDVVPGVNDVLDRIFAFAAKVRSGEWKGCTGKSLKNVVSIGIGGSYLGPEFVAEALRADKVAAAAADGRTLRFLANVDPVDVTRALDGLDASETIVVIESKTFTTAETMLNARTVRAWLQKSLGDGPVRRFKPPSFLPSSFSFLSFPALSHPYPQARSRASK